MGEGGGAHPPQVGGHSTQERDARSALVAARPRRQPRTDAVCTPSSDSTARRTPPSATTHALAPRDKRATNFQVEPLSRDGADARPRRARRSYRASPRGPRDRTVAAERGAYRTHAELARASQRRGARMPRLDGADHASAADDVARAVREAPRAEPRRRDAPPRAVVRSARAAPSSRQPDATRTLSSAVVRRHSSPSAQLRSACPSAVRSSALAESTRRAFESSSARRRQQRSGRRGAPRAARGPSATRRTPPAP